MYSVYGCFYERFHVSGCQKTVSESNVICQLRSNVHRMSNVFVDVNVGAKNHNFNIPLILDTLNIIIVMQTFNFMQEFTSAISAQCLHSSLQAKLLMHNCARAKHAKTCFYSI